MIYYQEPSATLYQGHAIDVLRELPAESVDCVMTSPPYWGLRTYKTEPIVWGDKQCGHEWAGDNAKTRIQKGWSTGERTVSAGAISSNYDHFGKPEQGNFCLKCHAWKGELGLEPTIELYVSHLLQIFDEVKRVLKKTGTVWVNIGDSYGTHSSGSKKSTHNFYSAKVAATEGIGTMKKPDVQLAKSLCLIPERFALGMVDRGWILRNVIIWFKSNPMPESMKDRFTGTYEYLYFFTKAQRYWFEQQFEPNLTEYRPTRPETSHGKEPTPSGRSNDLTYNKMSLLGRNKRDVWEINTQPSPLRGVHFATFPEKLVETPILAGCPQDGTVLDPFAGSGTVGTVAKRLGRKYIGIELSEKYCKLHKKRLQAVPLAMELV